MACLAWLTRRIELPSTELKNNARSRFSVIVSLRWAFGIPVELLGSWLHPRVWSLGEICDGERNHESHGWVSGSWNHNTRREQRWNGCRGGPRPSKSRLVRRETSTGGGQGPAKIRNCRVMKCTWWAQWEWVPSLSVTSGKIPLMACSATYPTCLERLLCAKHYFKQQPR